MESLAEHIGLIVSIMGSMVVLIGFLLSLLGRIIYKNNEQRQAWQDDRLQKLEQRQAKISGEHDITKNDVGHLAKILEELVKELKEERKTREEFQLKNTAEHEEIKGMIGRLQTPAPA